MSLLHSRRFKPLFWALALCLCLTAVVVAQDFNLSDIYKSAKGLPSRVALNQGKRNFVRSEKKHTFALASYTTKIRTKRQRNRERISQLRNIRRSGGGRGSTDTRKSGGQKQPDKNKGTKIAKGEKKNGQTQSTGKGGKSGGTTTAGNNSKNGTKGPGKSPGKNPPPKNVVPQPAPEPPLLVEVPRQNLTLALVNPKGEPITGLSILASIQTSNDDDESSQKLVSDEKGEIKLKNISLPASVDLDLPEAPAPQLAREVAGESEWRFADPEMASLLLEMPQGRSTLVRLEDIEGRRNDASRIAGLTLPSGVKPMRLAVSRTRIEKIKVYDARRPSIVLERNLVDLKIKAPAGSQISSPIIGDETLTVPESGTVPLQLSRSGLAEGIVPFRIGQTLTGGEAEAVINDYTTDPYSVNEVEAPPLRLVRMSNLDAAGRLGVFARKEDVVQAIGDLEGKANKQQKLGTIIPTPDGAKWWSSPVKGLAFKMRPIPGSKPDDKKAPLIVERVRVIGTAGGSIGGVTVGMAWQDAVAALGTPQVENEPISTADALSTAGQVASYLDGGLRISHDDQKVLWVEVARPDTLLREGTTAFVRRPQARLYVERFTGHKKTNLRTLDDLNSYLSQIGSVQLVSSREDADLVLTARVADFTEDRDEVTNLIPYRYDCEFKIEYSLFDVATQTYPVKDKIATGTAKVDYSKEAILVGVGAGLLRKKAGGLISGLLIGFGIAELNDSVRKAANRAPAISAKTAFNQMVRDINDAADFTVRVTAIDYERGRLTINAGTNDGVRVGDINNPFDFQLSVAGKPLPFEESPKNSEFYVARVIEASEQSCICELRYYTRKVSKAKEKIRDESARDMLRQIPDPASGLIAGRAGVQFPDMEVISEEQVRNATAESETGE